MSHSDKLTYREQMEALKKAEEQEMKIFITGCAKSGTTLLYRLFNYFEGVELLIDEQGTSKNEVWLKTIINTQENGKHLVGKRKRKTILSLNMPTKDLFEQRRQILDNDIKIVNIIRDGRDVILSDNKKVPVERWMSSISQRNMFIDIINAEVRYEDIIYHPDEVQERLADSLGLKIKHKFSEYPKYIDDKFFGTKNKKLYGARPISDVSVGKDLGAYRFICLPEQVLPFEHCLAEVGYL